MAENRLSIYVESHPLEVSEHYGVFSVSILKKGRRLGLKCLLLSYFRVGDDPTGI